MNDLPSDHDWLSASRCRRAFVALSPWRSRELNTNLREKATGAVQVRPRFQCSHVAVMIARRF